MDTTDTANPILSGPAGDSFPRGGGFPVWLASLAVFAIAAAFNFYIGLIVFMGDSYLLADRAKHLILSGNLNLNNQLASLIYPPLYAVLISPSYLSSDPATSFRFILLIHSFLVSCQVWPFYKLLVEYSKISRPIAVWLAGALSLAPFTLPYSSMMLTEVAYIPALLWMVYHFLRYQQSAGAWDAFRAGACLGLMLLCRTAATTIVVSIGGAIVVTLWHCRADRERIRARITGAIALSAAVAVTFGLWKLYEKLFIQYGAPDSYFTKDDIKIIFAEAKRFDHHAAWLTNTIFYYLTAPLCLAGCFFYSLIFRRLKPLLRDPLFPLAILSLLVSAVTVVLVMTQSWGGRELTWNKYLAPYVFFILLIALRYRAQFNRAQFRTSVIVLSVIFLAFKPSALGCHFTDALVLFTNNSSPLGIPESAANALYLCLTFIPAWLWVRQTTNARTAAIAITGLVWVSSLLGTANAYRNSGDLNISRYTGAAYQALTFAKSNPSIRAYYDPAFVTKDFFGALRILFYWPTLVSPAQPEDLAALTAKSNAPVIYFSDRELEGIKPVAEDRGTVRFYAVTSKTLPGAAPSAELLAGKADAAAGSLKAVLGPNVWGSETAVWQGKSFSVRWLGASTEFEVNNPRAAGAAVIRTQLGVASAHRTVTLMANGEMSTDKHLVTKVFWGHGPQTVTFRVNLKSGRNSFSLFSPEPLEKLPGGRSVAFLQIGDIVAVPR